MSQEETYFAEYSSNGRALSLLAREMPPGRAERFLGELANLTITDPDSRSRFEKAFSDFIPATPGTLFAESQSASSPLSEVHSFRRIIFTLQHLLRAAWDCPTALEREVHLALTWQEVNKQFLRATGMKPDENPEIHALWKSIGNVVISLTLARRVADRMRRCGNSSCPAPYFIAKRRTQKYCTEVCAEPAQREQKSAWWSEHGEQWREKQKGQKSKAGKGRRS